MLVLAGASRDLVLSLARTIVLAGISPCRVGRARCSLRDADRYGAVAGVTTIPSGTFPTFTGVPTAPVAIVTGRTSLVLVSTTHATAPSGVNPTA